MCKTETQEAKSLYRMLRDDDLVDIMFEGLMGDAVWISSGDRAYRLKDLSNGHLSNIVTKYQRRGEEIPDCILFEVGIRKEAV